MFELVETLPGLRIADKNTLDEYHQLVGSSYGPHQLRKMWISIWVGEKKSECSDYSFQLASDDVDGFAVFSVAVLCVLRAWKRNMKVIVASPRGESRSAAIIAAALSIDHGIEFTDALWMLKVVCPKIDPSPEMLKFGMHVSGEQFAY